MRAVMEYWLEKLSALPAQPSNNQIKAALEGSATAAQLNPFIAQRLSDSRARGGTIRNIGAHHFFFFFFFWEGKIFITQVQ